MIKITPNKKDIAAEIICDLTNLSNLDLKKIKSALEKYGVIYFKKQNLTPSSYIKFAKNFGKLENYPKLKGLNKKYPQITVVQRKSSDKGPSFGEQFHIDSIYKKNPPRFTMLLSKLVPKKGVANTEFCSQYLSYKDLPINIKKKLKLAKGVYSSEGIIQNYGIKKRAKEKEKKVKELISDHKILKKINSNYAIYFSPGHFVGFKPKIKNYLGLKKFLINHQVKKKFQFSLEWEKNQLAIWDNRSMLHQATPFKGNRIMHRIIIN